LHSYLWATLYNTKDVIGSVWTHPSIFPCTRHQKKFIWSSWVVRGITIRKKIVPKRISINVEKDENQRRGSCWTPKKRTRVNEKRFFNRKLVSENQGFGDPISSGDPVIQIQHH
jgi:hypothetical protein